MLCVLLHCIKMSRQSHLGVFVLIALLPRIVSPSLLSAVEPILKKSTHIPSSGIKVSAFLPNYTSSVSG